MDIYGLSDGANEVRLAESMLAAETTLIETIGARRLSKKMSSTNDDIRYVWRHCDAVCFDVDSTVCQDEAIDELAEFCGVGQQVAEV